ncbi:MAG: hypothetical protein JRC68_05285, partial [Deltaproteobacteria bacterium]|nr:hypothetical protein [Deltaproteobacteria bacterium]
MIKKENLKQAIDAISDRDPETGYSLNEMLGTGQIDIPLHSEETSEEIGLHFLFDKEKVSINKFLFFNEGTVPIEQGLLIKYGEMIGKQELSNREGPLDFFQAAKEIHAIGLRFMVTHEIDFAIARLKKSLKKDELETQSKLITLLENIKRVDQTIEIPGEDNDRSVLYRGTVDIATPA